MSPLVGSDTMQTRPSVYILLGDALIISQAASDCAQSIGAVLGNPARSPTGDSLCLPSRICGVELDQLFSTAAKYSTESGDLTAQND